MNYYDNNNAPQGAQQQQPAQPVQQGYAPQYTPYPYGYVVLKVK